MSRFWWYGFVCDLKLLLSRTSGIALNSDYRIFFYWNIPWGCRWASSFNGNQLEWGLCNNGLLRKGLSWGYCLSDLKCKIMRLVDWLGEWCTDRSSWITSDIRFRTRFHSTHNFTSDVIVNTMIPSSYSTTSIGDGAGASAGVALPWGPLPGCGSNSDLELVLLVWRDIHVCNYKRRHGDHDGHPWTLSGSITDRWSIAKERWQWNEQTHPGNVLVVVSI